MMLVLPSCELSVQRESAVIAMIGVAGPARLMRVMSQLGSLLPPINRLDRHVDIQDPRLTQYRLDACSQLTAEPFHASALLYAAHRSTHYVFTDCAPHVQ